MFIYAYTYACIYIYTNLIHTHIYIFTYIYTYTYSYLYLNAHIFVPLTKCDMMYIIHYVDMYNFGHKFGDNHPVVE